MIADLKTYPEYQDSGLPWHGPVPGHWEVKRLKNWVAVNARTLSESTPGTTSSCMLTSVPLEQADFPRTSIDFALQVPRRGPDASFVLVTRLFQRYEPI